jgi:cytochrome c biogenesis protein CcmG, thiol:disulfide interchange protein DsbE
MFNPLFRSKQLRNKSLSGLALMIFLGAVGTAQAIDANIPAPEFDLPGQNGSVKLAHQKGKVVYLDYWASWCGPCRQSFPWMNEMQTRFASQGLQIIAVNLDAKPDDARKFLADNNANFIIAYDPKGETPRLYGVKGMPTSILIGRDGKVLFQHVGFNQGNRADLEQRIHSALGEKK